MNFIKQYFKTIDFQNVSETRFLLAKAKREHYPISLVNELENKVQGYETMVDREMFK